VEFMKDSTVKEITVYTPTNAGDYALVEHTTNDIMLVQLWANKPRKSQSQNTAAQYLRQGMGFLDAIGKPLQAVNYTDLQAWQNGLTGSINTLRLKVNAIKSLLSFAHKVGYIRVNPAVMLEAPQLEETKHRKVLSEEDVIRLVSSGLSARDQAILRVLYSSACRVSELINLRWQDVIDTGDGKAVLVIRGKGGKTREAGISASAYAAMLNVKTAFVEQADYVFLSNRKRQMDRTTVNHLFKKLSEIVGKDISPHWFRHSHVSHALARGANPVDVQEQAGHSSLQVTTSYAHKTKNSSDYLVI
jgi:integrase/recombinase XerD